MFSPQNEYSCCWQVSRTIPFRLLWSGRVLHSTYPVCRNNEQYLCFRVLNQHFKVLDRTWFPGSLPRSWPEWMPFSSFRKSVAPTTRIIALSEHYLWSYPNFCLARTLFSIFSSLWTSKNAYWPSGDSVHVDCLDLQRPTFSRKGIDQQLDHGPFLGNSFGLVTHAKLLTHSLKIRLAQH